MSGGISKFFIICKYPFYELKSHKQRIAPDDPVSHYSCQEKGLKKIVSFVGGNFFDRSKCYVQGFESTKVAKKTFFGQSYS